MLCKICNKNPATIHIQEIVNGEKKTLHICAECASKKSKEDPVLQGFNLAEMLYSLSGQMGIGENGGAAQSEKLEQAKEGDEFGQTQAVCPKCGWDTARFRKTGRLGCAQCYETFAEIVTPALANMHRGTLHAGKVPGGASEASDISGKRAAEIMKLQKELEERVRREEFEQAARLRDKIAELKAEASGAKGQEGSR